MSDYQRYIYYVYNYENGHKKNNVGFIRMEKTNGKCRITMRIRVPSMNEKSLQACFFVRERGEIYFLPFATMKIHDMVGENRIVLEKGNILDSEYNIDDIEGVVIYESIEKYFGSEWKADEPICFREFKLADKKKQESPFLQSAKKQVMEKAEKKLHSIEYTKEYQEQKKQVLEQKPDRPEKQLHIAEAAFDKNPQKQQEFSSDLPDIFYQFPHIFPFEDDELTDCVRIEPQDIGRLPMEDWVLANNSFLLHSYYSYRHLLLARKTVKDGTEYVLCAPGICQNREEFMASMFGFCDFKPVRRVKDKKGEFGYWYMPVIV